MATFDHTTQTGYNAGTAVSWPAIDAVQSGTVRNVSTNAQMTSALSVAQAGDIIQLANGTYSGDWTISTPNLVIRPSSPGVPGTRNVTKDGGRIIINAANTILGGFRFGWTSSPLSNQIQINAADCRICDFDIRDITTPQLGNRILLVGTNGDRFRFDHNLVRNCAAFILVVDPGSGNFAQSSIFEYNNMEDCSVSGAYIFQIGNSVGNFDLTTGNSKFRFNHVKNCYSSQVKASDFQVENNWFYGSAYVPNAGFNHRGGKGNTYRNNVFDNIKIPIRVFHSDLKIINNVFLNATETAIEICEGSTTAQRSLANYQHDVSERVLIANNVIISPVKYAINIGDPQTGALGSTHPEPNSPQHIKVRNNAIIISGSAAVAIRVSTPDTVPAAGDGYSTTIPEYHKYNGLEITNNQINVSGGAVTGEAASTGAVAWANTTYCPGAIVQDNIPDALNFTGTFRPPSNYSGLNKGISYNYLNSNTASETDFDSNPRTSGASVDTGAVEYQSTVSSSTTRVLDNFTGSNGTAITAHTPDQDEYAGGWQVSAVGMTIESNSLAFSAVNQYAYVDVGGVDQLIKATFNAGGADNRVAIRARSTPSNNTHYQFGVRPGANQIYISKTVSGVLTEIFTAAYTFNLSTTYSLEFQVVRSNLRALINSVEVASLPDSSILTGKYCGLTILSFTTAASRFDAFDAATLNYVNGAVTMNQRADTAMVSASYSNAASAMKQNIQMTGSGSLSAVFVNAQAIMNQSIVIPVPGQFVNAQAVLNQSVNLTPGIYSGPVWQKVDDPITQWTEIKYVV